jgi:hypothetical protein
MKISKGIFAFLLLAIFLPSGYGQNSDYTLESAIDKLLDWSAVNSNINEYRWNQTSKKIKDEFIGASIKIPYLIVDSTRISVDNGKANYNLIVHLEDVEKAFQFSKKPAKVFLVSTEQFQRGGSPVINLVVHDGSDRLAMELSGTEIIGLVGRINKMEISDGGVLFDVNIITWSKAK